MNPNEEIAKFKFVGFLFLLFIFSAFHSCTELRYTLTGKTAEGKYIDARKTGRRGRKVALVYSFSDKEGKSHKGRVEVYPGTAERLAQEPVKVIYLPSNPMTNTLVSRRNIISPIIFVVISCALIASILWLYLKARKATAHKR